MQPHHHQTIEQCKLQRCSAPAALRPSGCWLRLRRPSRATERAGSVPTPTQQEAAEQQQQQCMPLQPPQQRPDGRGTAAAAAATAPLFLPLAAAAQELAADRVADVAAAAGAAAAQPSQGRLLGGLLSRCGGAHVHVGASASFESMCPAPWLLLCALPRLETYSGWVAYGASVAIVCAILVELVSRGRRAAGDVASTSAALPSSRPRPKPWL
jgi:hypothetical protein